MNSPFVKFKIETVNLISKDRYAVYKNIQFGEGMLWSYVRTFEAYTEAKTYVKEQSELLHPPEYFY